MQTNKKKTKKPIEIVSKPYVRGTLFDKTTLSSSLKFFGALVGMTLAYLFLGTMLVFDMRWLSLILNAMILLAALGLFLNNGAGRSVALITQGEVLHNRRESGRKIDPDDERSCYHPLKGFVNALLGTIPFFVLAVILALTAQRQMTSTGTLPSWIEHYESRPEIGMALQHYHESDQLTLTAACRIVTRMMLMPFVTIVGATNFDGLLVLERVSPLLTLLPALFYGFGYTRGPAMRTAVHTKITDNNRKRVKREKREQRQRRNNQPEQLN